MAGKKITDKRLRFVDEYMIDLNATQAALRAGYSPKTATMQGSRLLTYDDIRAEIAKRQHVISKRLHMTADEVLDGLASLARSNMGDYMKPTPAGDPHLDFSDLTREQTGAMQEVTVEDFIDGRGEDARDVRRVKFKLYDRGRALVDLGKHLGLFKERVELTGADGQPLMPTRIERVIIDPKKQT